LVESFVDSSCYSGTCYRAANWIAVGKTKGRGRQDRFNEFARGVAKGDWPAVKAYYRMIDQPDESAVNMISIMAPHRERTIRRMMGQKTVLCVQDGSDLTYTDLDQCEGLGEMGTNQEDVSLDRTSPRSR